MDIQLRRVSGDYIDCQFTEGNTTVLMDSLSHKQAEKLLETFEAASAGLKHFLSISEVEKPTVIVTITDGVLDYVEASCETTAIIVVRGDDLPSYQQTPEGYKAFVYGTGCEALEPKSIQQWAALVA